MYCGMDGRQRRELINQYTNIITMNNLTLDEKAFSHIELAEIATESTVNKGVLCVESFHDTITQLKKDIDDAREQHARVELYNISVLLEETLIELRKLV
jgi:hypothetical protein